MDMVISDRIRVEVNRLYAETGKQPNRCRLHPDEYVRWRQELKERHGVVVATERPLPDVEHFQFYIEHGPVIVRPDARVAAGSPWFYRADAPEDESDVHMTEAMTAALLRARKMGKG